MKADETKHHISSYSSILLVLLTLLLLTTITVAITSVELGPLTVTAALLIACIKVGLVIAYFMHIKYESNVFRNMVIGVFFLFLVVVLITFIDYAYR